MGERKRKPLYYAKDDRVWRRPIEHKTATGTTFSIGFPVCTPEPMLTNGPETIAALLNMADPPDDDAYESEPT